MYNIKAASGFSAYAEAVIDSILNLTSTADAVWTVSGDCVVFRLLRSTGNVLAVCTALGTTVKSLTSAGNAAADATALGGATYSTSVDGSFSADAFATGGVYVPLASVAAFAASAALVFTGNVISWRPVAVVAGAFTPSIISSGIFTPQTVNQASFTPGA